MGCGEVFVVVASRVGVCEGFGLPIGDVLVGVLFETWIPIYILRQLAIPALPVAPAGPILCQ